MRDILNATQYSTIYDLKEKMIYLYLLVDVVVSDLAFFRDEHFLISGVNLGLALLQIVLLYLRPLLV